MNHLQLQVLLLRLLLLRGLRQAEQLRRAGVGPGLLSPGGALVAPAGAPEVRQQAAAAAAGRPVAAAAAQGHCAGRRIHRVEVSPGTAPALAENRVQRNKKQNTTFCTCQKPSPLTWPTRS